MGYDKKGKGSSKAPSSKHIHGHGHGHAHGEQNVQDEQDYSSHNHGADVPRSGVFGDGDFGGVMGTSQEQSIAQDYNTGYTHGGQAYVQQGQWQGQQPDSSSSSLFAQPPTSSFGGTGWSQSSLDTSSRGQGRQYPDGHRRHQGGAEASQSEQALNTLAEQQLSGETVGYGVPYEATVASNPALYQGGNAGNPFAAYVDPYYSGSQIAPRVSRNPRPAGSEYSIDAARGVSGKYNSLEFFVGRVLRIKWPEPSNTETSRSEWSVKANDVYSKDRRFVIIRNERGHSVGIPIMTYGGQACTKAGVHPEHHGIIYTDAEPPLLPGEENLGYRAITMVPYRATEALLTTSRVNYTKRYTIEHNVRVTFVGHIIEQDIPVLAALQV